MSTTQSKFADCAQPTEKIYSDEACESRSTSGENKVPPLKPGDLVAVYDQGRRLVCRVRFPAPKGNWFVSYSGLNEATMLQVHPKQMRKLKPIQKPREFWINRYALIGVMTTHESLDKAHRSRTEGSETIHVREVRK